MAKRYVLDTNILIHSPSALFDEGYSDGIVTILLPVVGEIDNLKMNARDPELKFRARRAARYLNDIRKGLKSEHPDYVDKFEFQYQEPIVDIASLNIHEIVDDLIISMTSSIGMMEEEEVILVSGDINVILKAEAIGIPTIKFDFDDSVNEADYQGWTEIKVSQSDLSMYVGLEAFDKDEYLKDVELCDNEYVILYTDDCDYNAFFRYFKGEGIMRRIKGNLFFADITSRNKLQRLFMESLDDDKVVCVSGVGCAGSGKSLISIAYAVEMVMNRNKFKKFLYIKPLDVVGGKDIGYLPGTKEEKLEGGVMGSFYDSIEVIFDTKNREEAMHHTMEMMDRGLLEIEAISFLRGRSFKDTVLIIDEAQNTDIVTIRTILSRVGENCKVILLGDVSQVDNHRVSHYTNGLYVAKQKLKDHRLYSHVELQTSVRSEFAELVNKLMPESEGGL